MSETPKPITTYSLNGSVNFAIPFEYLARKFIIVTLIGATTRRELVLTDEYRFTSKTQITLNRVWGEADGYTLIEIKRHTSATDRLVNFSDGSILRAYDLNTSQIQSLHIAEEGRTTAEGAMLLSGLNWDAQNRKIINMNPGVDPKDAVNVSQVQSWIDSMEAQKRYLKPSAFHPTKRDDGTPLQNGDHYFNTQANVEFNWSGGVWWAANIDSQALSGPYGATLVGHMDNQFGSVLRSLSKILNDSHVNVKNYGAIADGTYHPLSEFYPTLAAAQLHYVNVPVTSLSDSVDWAATVAAVNVAEATKRPVYAPGGGYVLTKTVESLCDVYGDGQMESPSTPQDFLRLFEVKGTTWLYKGTGPKVHVANLAATAGDTTDDVHTNMSSVEPGYDSTYKKTSFWNNDANPVTGAPATQKLFSCGWKVKIGGFVKMYNMSFIPWSGTNGVDGYNAGLPVWADDWDIGLWVDNHHDFYAENISIVGYWRMAGCFGRTSLPGNDMRNPDWERNKFVHCIFQGWASFLLRGSDLFDIKSVGTDYIDIDWFDSHPFDPAFDNTFRTQEYGGLFCTYTGTQKIGSILRITGVSPSPAGIDPANNSNKVILGRRTNGVADATWDNCYFYGMNHRLYRATSAAFGAARYNNPSRCIEISGGNIRGLKFNDSCKVMSADDIGLYLGNVLQFEYNGSFESKNVENRGSGIRNVASKNSYQIRLGQKVRGSSGCDMRPAYATTDGRFTTPGDLGNFNPNQVLWDGWSYGVNGHVDIRPGAGQRVSFTDANGVPRVYRTADGEFDIMDNNGVRLAQWDPEFNVWTFKSATMEIQNATGQKRFLSTPNDANMYGLVNRLYNADGTVVMVRVDASTTTIDVTGRIRPDTDGSRNLGDSAKRWSVVYAVTGTINTSDATHKSPVFGLTMAELRVGIRLSREIGTFMWLNSVEEKEGGARLHVGMTVQRAIEIFVSEGLDPFRYGCVCYDEWEDEYQEDDGVTRLTTPAGALFGFREGELHALMIRSLAYQMDNFETRLVALES